MAAMSWRRECAPGGAVAALVGLIALSSCQSGTDRVCGDGTDDIDDSCRSLSLCGDGTVLQNGSCVAASSDGACEGRFRVSDDGSRCVLADAACDGPAQLDQVTGLCVAPDEIACGAGTELVDGFCVPACEGEFEVPNARRNGCDEALRLQLVNASPDPSLSTVDIYFRGALLEDSEGNVIGDDIALGSATPVIKRAIGSGFPLDIVPGDSDDGSTPLISLNAAPTSDPLAQQLIVLRGVVDPSGFSDAANDATTIDLELASYGGLREEAASSNDVQFAFFHSVTDASTINVSVVDGEEVALTSAAYTSSGPLMYTNDIATGAPLLGNGVSGLRFSDGDSLNTLLQTTAGAVFPSDVGFPPGAVGVLVATGFVDPGANLGGGTTPGAPFRVFAVLPDGTGAALDVAE
ncbi:MAG: hypothetical protein AAFP04_13510 [Myxococcota bacterium]